MGSQRVTRSRRAPIAYLVVGADDHHLGSAWEDAHDADPGIPFSLDLRGPYPSEVTAGRSLDLTERSWCPICRLYLDRGHGRRHLGAYVAHAAFAWSPAQALFWNSHSRWPLRVVRVEVPGLRRYDGRVTRPPGPLDAGHDSTGVRTIRVLGKLPPSAGLGKNAARLRSLLDDASAPSWWEEPLGDDVARGTALDVLDRMGLPRRAVRIVPAHPEGRPRTDRAIDSAYLASIDETYELEHASVTAEVATAVAWCVVNAALDGLRARWAGERRDIALRLAFERLVAWTATREGPCPIEPELTLLRGGYRLAHVTPKTVIVERFAAGAASAARPTARSRAR